MVLGLRYPATGSYNGAYIDDFQENSFRGFNGAGIISSTIAPYRHLARVYVAPSRYSGVRKVIFWAAVRHEYTTAQATYVTRLRIAPQSPTNTVRSIMSATVAPSNIYREGNNITSIWAPEAIPTTQAALYDWSGIGNAPILTRYTDILTTGENILFAEFDRFDAASAAFFADWDAVAAGGDEDVYVAYRPVVERLDGIIWSASDNSNRTPILYGFGFTVVQAPQPVNKTCIYVPASFGWKITLAINNLSGLSAQRPWMFPYRAADWDGDMTVNVFMRQSQNSGGQRMGNFNMAVFSNQNLGSVDTDRYFENFPTNWNDQDMVGRTGDILPSIVDGDTLTTKWETNVAGNVPQPRAWFEITLSSFNRCRVFFTSGNASGLGEAIFRGGDPPPDKFGLNEGLFDPLWFENLPEENILDAKVFGQMIHALEGNDARQRLILNADLDSDIPNSIFNAHVLPEVSSTPNATESTYRIVFSEITSNNPINFAGMRKLKTLYTDTPWQNPAREVPGLIGICYALFVPNREFLEQGPIFEVGAFNPEGCASTSAGLGEPATLVITNGSVIPKKFVPAAEGTAGEIEDAGIPTPFEGEVPIGLADDDTCSPDGGLEAGIYKYRYTFRNCCTDRESDPNPEDIEVDTTGATPCAKVDFSFAGVRIPSDEQICEICLYRTLVDGDFPVMAKVGCFDPNVTELFTDTVSDDALDFINEGLSILNGPMPCVPIVVEFRNRLFGMGDIPNLAPGGTVSVENGSTLVVGSDAVEWDRCLEGKFIQVEGDCRAYEILRILPPEEGISPPIGRLRLVDEYEGATGSSLSYHICGRPNRLYGSEPFEPEYWPAANFLDIEPGDGDKLMGAVSNFDSLVICKRRKTYLLRFNENPFLEVFMPTRISSDIGCIGPRTFAQVESGSVWLSDRGIVIFDGRTVQHLPASDAMNDMFTDVNNTRYVRRDRNGRVIDAVGVFYPAREQYLLLVPTVRSDRGCDVMIVWDTKLNNVTILEFCQQFQSMVVGKDTNGDERVYMGDTNGFVWIFDVGYTDGVGLPNATGTVRGTVTAAGVEEAFGVSFLDDDTASFITGGLPGAGGLSGVVGLSGAFSGLSPASGDLGLAGACVYTRAAGAAYDDPWTVRTIFAATSTRLYVTPAWGAEAPAIGDDYMIGAINFDCLFKPQNYGTDDMTKRDWRQIIVHEVEEFASKIRIDLLPDFQFSDPEADTVQTDGIYEGRTFLMDYSKGRQVRPVGKIVHAYMAVRIRNFAPEEPVRIINHSLAVEARESK